MSAGVPEWAKKAAQALTLGDKLYIPGEGWCDPEEIAAIIVSHAPADSAALREALQRMVKDEFGEHLCDNDGRGCPACELAEKTLDTLAAAPVDGWRPIAEAPNPPKAP